MTNGAGWDLLYNGSMVRAAYEVYDGSAAFNGFAFGILYFILHAMLYYKTRKAMPGFVIDIFFLSMYYGNQLFGFLRVHESIAWVAGFILIIHIGILLYEVILKH